MIHVLWDLGNAILRNVGNHSPKYKSHILRFKVFEALRDAGFRREVAENCATFRSNLSAPSLSTYRGFGATCRSRLQVLTEVSGQPFGPVFESVPTFRDNLSVLSSSPYRRFGTTYPFGKGLPLLAAYLSRRSAVPVFARVFADTWSDSKQPAVSAPVRVSIVPHVVGYDVKRSSKTNLTLRVTANIVICPTSNTTQTAGRHVNKHFRPSQSFFTLHGSNFPSRNRFYMG